MAGPIADAAYIAMSVEDICALVCAEAGWSDRDAAELEFYDMHGCPATAEGA